MRSVFFFGKYQKELAIRALPSYSSPMNKPQQLAEGFQAIAPQLVEEKQTERFEERYFVNGEQVGGYRTKEGLRQYNDDGRTVLRTIPNGAFEIKVFVTVREYKTTVWEIVEQ